MSYSTYLSKSEKHTCIFELERKGDYFTDNVVCRVCGVYLSSLGKVSPEEKPCLRPDKEDHPSHSH